MLTLESKLGNDNLGFLEALIREAEEMAKTVTSQPHFAALNGYCIRARRLIKAERGEIPHALNDSPSKLWADYSGALNT